MKVNLDGVMVDRKGHVLMLDPESSHVGDFLYHAVSLATDAKDVATKRRQASLMAKVAATGTVELSREECNTLLDCCARIFPVLHFSALADILEEKSCG